MTYQTNFTNYDSTEQFAARIGNKLRGGEVIELVSDLGGGKTTFVRGLARGMGSTDHVASPTFTISRQYQSKRLTLYHFDFYRLPEPGIIAAELQEVIDDSQAVVAIEWGKIVEGILPADRLTVRIVRTGETTRSVTVEYPEAFAYFMEGES